MADFSRLLQIRFETVLASRTDPYEEKLREIENSRTELKSQLKTIEESKILHITFEQVLNVFLEGSRATKRYLAFG